MAADEKDQRRPSWALRIGSVAGIPIRIHVTFWLLLVWVVIVAQSEEGGPSKTTLVAIVAALFGCIVLHELGHALTAKAFGIRTRDITLYPIGGISSLEHLGKPRQELIIALAGPCVNLAIAAVLTAVIGTVDRLPTPEQVKNGHMDFLQYLWTGNITLALFNLIPAFPMDGGRILRGALAGAVGAERATRLAATVGQGLAIVLAIVSFLPPSNPWLLFIAFFIFLGAGGEAEMQRTLASTAGYHMRDAMVTRFETISHGDSLAAVVDRLLRTSQEDFPVTHGDQVLGLLTRRRLLAALASEGKDAIVAGVMDRDFPRVRPDADLTKAIELLKSQASSPLLVFEAERLIGMVTLNNLLEFLSVSRAGAAPARSLDA
jgi:Zn-dependent protease/CBS domain-containing protein